MRHLLQARFLKTCEYWRYETHDMQPKHQNKPYPINLKKEAEIIRMQIVGPSNFDPATYSSHSLNVMNLFSCSICNFPWRFSPITHFTTQTSLVFLYAQNGPISSLRLQSFPLSPPLRSIIAQHILFLATSASARLLEVSDPVVISVNRRLARTSPLFFINTHLPALESNICYLTNKVVSDWFIFLSGCFDPFSIHNKDPFSCSPDHFSNPQSIFITNITNHGLYRDVSLE